MGRTQLQFESPQHWPKRNIRPRTHAQAHDSNTQSYAHLRPPHARSVHAQACNVKNQMCMRQATRNGHTEQRLAPDSLGGVGETSVCVT